MGEAKKEEEDWKIQGGCWPKWSAHLVIVDFLEEVLSSNMVFITQTTKDEKGLYDYLNLNMTP
jgi:hypothetical protein